MEGWIQLHRQLLVSDIFQNEKMLKVFVYCLLKASHKDHKQKVGRQTVELKPGQFVFGRKKASVELNMNESTLRDYMYALRDENTIDIKSANKFSVITVVNWELYQSKEENADNKYDNKKTTKGQQKDTNNNGNNGNNGNKKESPKQVYDESSLYFKMSNYFYSLILKNNPDHKKPNFQKWSDEFRKIVELDKKSKDEVREVMEFVQSDEFEMVNVLSPAKLRKRYDQLAMKVKRSKNNVIDFKKKEYNPSQRVVNKEDMPFG